MPGTNAPRWDGEYEFGSPWGDDEVGADDVDDALTDDDVEETDVRPCAACGADVYEESDVCPVCGEFIIHEQCRSAMQPGWRVLLILLMIIGLVLGAGLGLMW